MDKINNILNTNESKIVFIKGLINLAKSDGVIEDSEKAFFINVINSLELTKTQIKDINLVLNSQENVIDVVFENRRQSLFFFKEALQLCYMDGAYDESEKTIIAAIRKSCGISEKCINEIEKWVQEGIEWSLKGDRLIEMEG